MLGRLVILAVIMAAIIWILRWFTQTPAERVARVLRRGLLWGAFGLLILLAITGRLSPLLALVAAGIPLVLRVVGLLQLLPMVRRLLRGLGLAGPAGAAAGEDAAGRKSSLRTRFLEMRLEHDSGQMDGRVLEGRFRGRQLSELDLDALLDLLDECRAADAQSAAVLETYLDRAHGEAWAEQARRHARGHGAAANGRLSREEARQILGLAPDASDEEVRAAHRRLMQKYHPDRGGTDYLAAKINEAKQVLLGE